MDNYKVLFKETCGFNKWSIGIGSDANVVVEFNHYPNFGTINLHDLVGNDLDRLAKMFQEAADYFRALETKNRVEAAAKACAT
ncbi:MAG: hypothetical protein L0Y56_06190 [Nitrospira sp.]|nr:hypothetical protein [Nitrospira sp.]